MADYATADIDLGQSTLSPNFGPYVNEMLARGWGLASLPYQEFTGERYAGAQPLLQQAFTNAAQLGQNQSFTSPGIANQYMNPYTQNVVGIEQREAQRQADIAGTLRGSKFARAGAFGGARQAIENAEANRNLQTQLGDIQARGLNQAYFAGQDQFNKEQAQRWAGLSGLLTAGQQQQTLAQQPLDFGYSQWQESMKYPYQQTTYMQSLLSGLPLASKAYSPGGSGFGTAVQGGLAGLALYKALNPGATPD